MSEVTSRWKKDVCRKSKCLGILCPSEHLLTLCRNYCSHLIRQSDYLARWMAEGPWSDSRTSLTVLYLLRNDQNLSKHQPNSWSKGTMDTFIWIWQEAVWLTNYTYCQAKEWMELPLHYHIYLYGLSEKQIYLSGGNFLSACRDNLSVPSAGFKNPKRLSRNVGKKLRILSV